MERKQKPATYVAPMPKKKLYALLREFKEIGGSVVMNEESEQHLDYLGAEASTLNGYLIMLRRNPTRAAVYEELIHARQFREKLCDGTSESILLNEIAAKKELLERAAEFELTKEEIVQTDAQLKEYISQLCRMKGDI